jgi:hypothetical protein
VSPVAVGTGSAHSLGAADPGLAVLALVVALALQVGVNYANDYSDGIRGTDADRVGPPRLVGGGLAAPGTVRLAAFLCFGLAALAGLALVALSGAMVLLLVGAVAILAAWRYTGGNNPYGYRGLGEVAVFVFFGLVAVVGTTWSQARPGRGPPASASWPARSWWPTTCATSRATGWPASEPWRCDSASVGPACCMSCCSAGRSWPPASPRWRTRGPCWR